MRKRYLPIIFILLLSAQVNAQLFTCIYDSFEIFGTDTINRFVNGNKSGEWLEFDNGRSFESKSSFMPSGASDRDRMCYHKRHFSSFSAKGKYIKGIKVGEWNYYYLNQQLEKKEYYNSSGNRDKTWTEYYQDSSIKATQNWKDGKLLSQRVLYENQTLWYSSKEYTDTTSFKIFWPNGNLKYQGMVVNSWEIISLDFYNSNGESRNHTIENFGILLSQEGLTNYQK